MEGGILHFVFTVNDGGRHNERILMGGGWHMGRKYRIDGKAGSKS